MRTSTLTLLCLLAATAGPAFAQEENTDADTAVEEVVEDAVEEEVTLEDAEADPIAPNLIEDGADNPEGRAQNRRVEFTLPDEG